VRAKVQGIIDTGEQSFEVSRLAQGDDPAFGIVKTVLIEYTADRKPLTVTGTDTDTISLTSTAAASEPVAEVRRNADDQLVLEAWEAGRYELTTACGHTFRPEVPAFPLPLKISGPWVVSFASGCGAPDKVAFDQLVSWPSHSDPGVKYFSGTANYTTTFAVPPEWSGTHRRFYLDLGRVAVIAEVKLNGHDLGVLWKPPFRVDATDAVQAGENSLEVKIVNLWVNRMIGDEQLPEDSARNPNGTLKEWPQWLQEGKPSPTARHTFSTWRLWKKDAPLQESGLLGPVTLRAAAIVAVRP